MVESFRPLTPLLALHSSKRGDKANAKESASNADFQGVLGVETVMKVQLSVGVTDMMSF